MEAKEREGCRNAASAKASMAHVFSTNDNAPSPGDSMTINRVLAWVSIGAALAACESGDINLQPTNISTGGGSGSGGGGAANPCASYAAGGVTQQGSFDGANCTYSSTFVSAANPIAVDLEIPFISGVHIFQDSLEVGTDVATGAAPAAGTGPKLVIAAGNTLAFQDSADYLRINRGSQLIAEGLASSPITLTGFTDAVSRTAGAFDVQLWGGLVLNGNGITNNCTDAQRTSATCHVTSEGQPSHYGGNDNAESSGVLRYVVIKHTGFEVAPGDELNGITFNAVGSGTTVENVQIYSAYDDGVEFFGGAVNVTNLVAMYVRDDSIDFSDGYVGTIKNALIIHPPQNGNNCIEGDNIASGRISGGAASTAPITMPTLGHVTCIMSNFTAGTHGASRGGIVRLGARAIVTDSIFEQGRAVNLLAQTPGASQPCLELDSASTPDTIAAAAAGESSINRTVLACTAPVPTADLFPNGDNQSQWILNNGAAPNAYAFNTNNAVFTVPTTASVLEPNTFFSFDQDAAPGTVTVLDGAGTPVVLTVADGYIGAVRSTADWTANWTYGIVDGRRGVAPWWVQ
jgi:hypothetical protein